MIPLHHEDWYTFRFADDRMIPKFHLEGLAPGTEVCLISIDPETDERQSILGRATVGLDGWVDLPQPLIVRSGDAFVVMPVKKA